jgi:PAS domain S-box-containing protein
MLVKGSIVMTNRKKVLIVENEQPLIESLMGALSGQSYVISCTSHKNAANTVRDSKPDIILLRSASQETHSSDIHQYLKQNKTTQNIPIIVITDNGNRGPNNEPFLEWADDFLLRPIVPSELVHRVSNLLKLRECEAVEEENRRLTNSLQLIENAKREWEQTIDCIDDIVLLIDEGNKIVRMNRRLCDLTGKDFVEMVGGDWTEIFRQAGFVSNSRSDNGCREFIYKDALWFSCRIYPVEKSVIRNAPGSIVTLKDVTEMKRTELALRESEEMFKDLAEFAPCAIFIFRDQRLLYINETAAQLTGYTTDELQRIGILSLVHSDHRKMLEDGIAELQHGDSSAHRYEIRTVRKYGEHLWLDMSTTIVHFGGEPCILAMAFDITGHKGTREALARSERLYRTFLDSMSDRAILKDDRSCYVMANKSFLTYYKKTENEVIGKTDYDLVGEDEARTRQASDREIRETGKTKRSQRTVDGRTYEIRQFPVQLGEGKTGVGSYIRDISLVKRAEEEVARLASFPQLSPNPVIEIDMTGLIKYANRIAWKLFAEHKEIDFRGRYIADIKDIAEQLRDSMETSRNRQVKIGAAWYLQAIHYVRETGFIRIYGYDISEQKRVEEALAESETKFKDLAEKSIVGIYLMQGNVFKYVNARFADIPLRKCLTA